MAVSEKVVIVGAGFGGLQAAKGLKRKVAEVVVIDRMNHHLFQPLLYEVASAVLSPPAIAVPIREVLRDQRNTVVIMGDIRHIDKKNNCLFLANGEQVSFDYLILAVGARHSYFGHDEWEAFAPGLKSVRDALKIRERLLMSFEMAERSDSISAAEKYLNFVIVGGGPTGVELAGAFAEIAHQTMIRNFRRINVSKTKIYLVEGLPQLLPAYPQSLAERAQRDLERLGVKVILNKMVTNVTSEGVQVGDQWIGARNIFWAAGNQASPLLRVLDVPLDRQGRVVVGSDCTIPGSPNIFAVGDCAHFEDEEGRVLPGIAPVAVQQGRYVARIIRKQLHYGERPPFRYFDKGTMATIGKNKAVGMIGEMQLTGYVAWLAWGFVHIAYLIGFRNRVIVMIQWMFQYFSGRRGARLIQNPIEEERK